MSLPSHPRAGCTWIAAKVPLVDRGYFNSARGRLCCAPGESDACSDLEATSQRGWCLTQIEGQKTPVIRDDQAKQTRPVEVADCSRGCHDHSDVTCVRQTPTAFKLDRVSHYPAKR